MAAKLGEKRTGGRREQILQTLAAMLERPQAEKITTAALAARLDVSEAALYRHFASKAQMFEGLIAFIEQSLFSTINKITSEQESGVKQVDAIVALLLGFAMKNPGMTRVLIGDALVNENERLQARINQLVDRLEATLKQSLRFAASERAAQGEGSEPALAANALISFVIGRWHQFAKSGFKRDPRDNWPEIGRALIGMHADRTRIARSSEGNDPQEVSG
ncbi:MAG: nucleoid occlusion factor SlmA [Burkholderiales bacterium]|nr:nucleoid occlusion factor SlmA [Burkholderiales bacterium]MDQ3195952.1 nucleoid occlusion factor SlmA [Pseudomonadota bacterium]